MIICQSNSRLVGYARVSTAEQQLSLQIDALRQHSVKKEHLFFDKISGAKEERPGLTACNETLRKDDTLVVWRLDRLGRSMRHLVNMIEELKERGIGFRSISDGMIDTTSASGELVRGDFGGQATGRRASFTGHCGQPNDGPSDFFRLLGQVDHYRRSSYDLTVQEFFYPQPLSDETVKTIVGTRGPRAFLSRSKKQPNSDDEWRQSDGNLCKRAKKNLKSIAKVSCGSRVPFSLYR